MRHHKSMAQSKAAKTAVAAAVAAAVASPAMAQERVIEEITVTATKREMNVQDVPVSITAVSSTKLQELNITNVTDLGKAVPGLLINNSGNQPVPIMRGAGAAGTTDIAVPVYVDNMYRPLAAQGLASYVDVERVEVLRGPQGTLFGRNTLGGLINVITKKPDFEEFDFGGAWTVGDYDMNRIEGFLNAPFSDTVALRVTLADEKRDPFVENNFNPDAGLKDSDYTYARAQLLWAPNESFDINFGATYWDDTANGNADYAYKCLGIPVNAQTQQFDGTANGFLDQRCGVRDGWDGGRPQAGNVSNGDESALVIPDPFEIAFDFAPVREIEETSFTVALNWHFPGHHLAVRGAYNDFSEDVITDTDLSSMNSLVAGHLRTSEVTQLDLNLNSERDGKLQYTIGAYYFDDTDAAANTYAFIWGYTYTDPVNPSWATWLYQGNGGTESTALYGQAEYSFTDRLRGTAGVRFSQDERQSFSLGVDQSTLSNPTPGYGGEPTPITGDDEHTDFRLGLQYDISGDVMLYGSASTGYIAGEVQELTNELLEPNEVDAYELGIKGTYADGRLQLNAAFYHNEYENLTTTVFVTAGTAMTIIAQQVPGGSLTSEGLEFEGSWYPTDNFAVDFGVAFDNTEFDEFSAANRVGSVDGGFPGSDFIDESGQGWFILDGDDVRFSPDLTANVGLSYTFDLAGGSNLRPWVYGYYSDEYKTTNDPIFWSVQDSYTAVDLGATWRSAGGNFNVGAFMINATDELIMTDATMFSRGRAMADFAPPRHWGVRMSYNF